MTTTPKTIDPESKLARAFRVARRGRRHGGGLLPAAQALSIARGMVATGTPIFSGSRDWVRWHGYPGNWAGDDATYYAADENPAFRDVCPADQVDGGPDHTGWYCNPYGEYGPDRDGLCFGVVGLLPGRGGECLAVAGYQFGDTDGGPAWDLSTIYRATGDRVDEARKEAAYAADELARINGEKERDYQTASTAGSLWAELGEECAEARREVLAILKERRKVKNYTTAPALCAAIAAQVQNLLSTIKANRAKRAQLASGETEGLWWQSSDGDQLSAFAESAGLTTEQARAIA